jgi:hypothetical protein
VDRQATNGAIYRPPLAEDSDIGRALWRGWESNGGPLSARNGTFDYLALRRAPLIAHRFRREARLLAHHL